MIVKPLAAFALRATSAAGSAIAALWTFPAMLCSAFLVAWGAEAAQFLISQGLALAALAWLQTLPEFAVEAVIAWDAGKDPATKHLAIANLTGAIRLLIGLGWPMIYFVAAWSGRKTGPRLPDIVLEREHAVEVMGLIGPLLWFAVIWWKRTFGVVDAAVLIALYVVYLWVLWQCPPRDHEELDEAPAVSRWAYKLGGTRRTVAIVALFVAGGGLLIVTTHPFLDSMLALAQSVGMSPFFAVQWLAPFLSEFPEILSTFNWARRRKGPMALMNLVSSNINQWTVLAAMIPLLYGWSHQRAHGTWASFTFDGEQEVEIALTVAQSVLAVLLLMDLRFKWHDAASLFVLWLAQFLVPHWRDEISVIYLAWCGWLVLLFVLRRRALSAPRVFLEVFRENRAQRARQKARSPGQ